MIMLSAIGDLLIMISLMKLKPGLANHANYL